MHKLQEGNKQRKRTKSSRRLAERAPHRGEDKQIKAENQETCHKIEKWENAAERTYHQGLYTKMNSTGTDYKVYQRLQSVSGQRNLRPT